jgi:PPK2 family polyphosphate:nucleotide phosphotransferase
MPDPFDVARYRADPGSRLHLRDHDPAYLPPRMTRADAEERLASETARLGALQEQLYAQHRASLLIVLQGMDASGKDGIIEHVFSGLNPQGCEVHSFKVPSEEELDHDFLWRTTVRLPARGDIGIFNRSHYEEVLVVRVHGELLDRQRLPAKAVSRRIWRERYEDIVAYERHLTRNGTTIRKIFLNVSKEEQRQRLLKRIADPAKQWKFAAGDFDQRARWTDYMRAYQDAIRATTTREAPWYIVPADHKWWARAVVSRIIVETLEGMDLSYPAVTAAQRRQMRTVRRRLRRS